MGKITKKVPVIFAGNVPAMISSLENLTFDLGFTLSTKVKISCANKDAANKPKLKVRVKKTEGNPDEPTDSLTLTSNKVNGKFGLYTIELIASDVQIVNPDYIAPVPDPDGDGPEQGVEGTPDLPTHISDTKDNIVELMIQSIDQGLEPVTYHIPITIKPKTYRVPASGLLTSPVLLPDILADEFLFLQKFKLNKRLSSIKLQQQYATTLVPEQPKEGTDKLYHTLAYHGFSDANITTNVLTINSSEMTVSINRQEGDMCLKLMTRSPDNKTVQVPTTADSSKTEDYVMPATDRTTINFFNIEVSHWSTPVLFLEPKFIIGYKGDRLPFKITNLEDTYARIEYSVQPESFAVVDSISKFVTFISAGYGKLHARAYDKYDMLFEETETQMFVEEAKTDNPVKIMMHNRKSGRLVTIKGNNKSLEDMVYAVSKETGVGITREYFNTTKALIGKPIILSPIHNARDYEGKVISSNFQVQFIGRRQHVGTVWEFARDQGFTNILDKRQKIMGNMVKQTDLYDAVPPIINCDVWVRVQYIDSDGNYSEWSDPVMFSAKAHNPIVGGETIVAGDGNNGWDGCFYKAIPKENLVTYNYRGNFQTLFDNNIKTFKENMQVTYEDKKYTVKTPMTPDTVQIPGTEDDYWVEDIRNFLCHPKNLVEMYGVAVGMTDKNLDGYSYGAEGIGDIMDTNADDYDESRDLKGWMFPDADYTWLKFGYQGKIIYVLNKPVCRKISWNDIAKREAHDGNRTVRLGNELYRLRMLTEDEYKVLLKGKSGMNNDALGIKEDSRELLLDDTNRPTKKVISADGTVGEMGHGYRGGTWRPVLEWVRPGTEPYIFLPWSPTADRENLVYDPITDTGYFGIVKKANFTTYEDFCSKVGFTEGGLDGANGTSDWIKFYWHGKVMFMSATGLRHTYNPDILQPKGISYHAKDLFPYASQAIVIKNVEYVVGQVSGCKWACVPKAAPFNVDDDIGQYSMWNELLYRVYGRWCTGTNNISGYNNYSGGYQIGDNWAELPMNQLNHGSNSMYVNCPEPDAMSVDGQRYFIQRCGSASDEPSLFHTWSLDATNDSDDGYMAMLYMPKHFYIDKSYFDQFSLLYPEVWGSTDTGIGLDYWWGGTNITILQEMLERLKRDAVECRNQLEYYNTWANENPYNPRTLKENWRYPPCRRYIGGDGSPVSTSSYAYLPLQWYNHYFKGANWNGSGWHGARNFFYECCIHVSADGWSIGSYNMGIANPYFHDSNGNDIEMRLTSTFDDGSIPTKFLSGVGEWGDKLVFTVNLHNRLIDWYMIGTPKIPYV